MISTFLLALLPLFISPALGIRWEVPLTGGVFDWASFTLKVPPAPAGFTLPDTTTIPESGYWNFWCGLERTVGDGAVGTTLQMGTQATSQYVNNQPSGAVYSVMGYQFANNLNENSYSPPVWVASGDTVEVNIYLNDSFARFENVMQVSSGASTSFDVPFTWNDQELFNANDSSVLFCETSFTQDVPITAWDFPVVISDLTAHTYADISIAKQCSNQGPVSDASGGIDLGKVSVGKAFAGGVECYWTNITFVPPQGNSS